MLIALLKQQLRTGRVQKWAEPKKWQGIRVLKRASLRIGVLVIVISGKKEWERRDLSPSSSSLGCPDLSSTFLIRHHYIYHRHIALKLRA